MNVMTLGGTYFLIKTDGRSRKREVVFIDLCLFGWNKMLYLMFNLTVTQKQLSYHCYNIRRYLFISLKIDE